MKYWIFWRWIWFPTQPGETKVFFRSWTCEVPTGSRWNEWFKQSMCCSCAKQLPMWVAESNSMHANMHIPSVFWGVVFNVGWGSSLLILRIAFLNSYCLAVLGESCWLNRDGSIPLEEKFDFRSWDRSSSGSCLQAYKTATVGTKSRSCRCCEITKLTADALVKRW